MKVAIQASKTFNDYNVFLRAMGVALSPMREVPGERLEIYSAGPNKLNNFVTGFVNLTEDSMKARGMGIKLYKVAPRWLEDHVNDMDYFAYLSRPKEPWSRLAHVFDLADVESAVFRY